MAKKKKIVSKVYSPKIDSELIIPKKPRENCILVLNLRLLLVRRDVRQIRNEGKTIRCRPWKDDEWRVFSRQVRQIAQRHFNDVFWLKPPDNYSGLDQPAAQPKYRPRLKCALKVTILHDARQNHHERVDAVRLANDKGSIRSNSGLYSHRDVEESKINGQKHITVVHEVGHSLGLDHPGVRRKVASCLRDGNRKECYEPDEELMGSGLKMIPAYANPWRRRAARHTKSKAEQWQVLMRSELPEPLSLRDVRNKAAGRIRQRVLDSVNDL